MFVLLCFNPFQKGDRYSIRVADLEEARTPGTFPGWRCLNIDTLPCIFNVVYLDNDVKLVGRRGEFAFVLFPLIVDNLKSHTPGVEAPAPGVGTIPLLDNGKT